MKKNTVMMMVFICLFGGLVLANEHAGGKIGVFYEPEMPIFSAQVAWQPRMAMHLLEKYGFDAQFLSSIELKDTDAFNNDKYSTLVIPYGNSFPLPAFESIRNFHRAGGNLVVNGIPFCHPAERSGSTWRDMGHTNYYDYKTGMGTGGFGNAVTGIAKQKADADNPLGIKDKMLPRSDESVQWLRVETLAPGDQAIPLILTKIGSNEYRPASALIRHGSDFNKAITLWMGQFPSQLEPTDLYLLEQIFIRGLSWGLHQAGHISKGEYESLIELVGAEKMPQGWPRGIVGKISERPWGDSFLPKSGKPASDILVIDGRRFSECEKMIASCLQGLTSRDKPRIWLWFKPQDRFWLDVHIDKGMITDTTVTSELADALELFKDYYNGAVAFDENLYRGNLIALNVGAVEDLLVMPSDLADKYGIPVKIDLRDKFEYYHEGMQWVWDNYSSQLNHHLTHYMSPHGAGAHSMAYTYQWKGIIFWITGPRDAMMLGAMPVKEAALMAKIFSQLPANVPMLGFPYAGKGVGLGEVGGTNFAGMYGKLLIPSDHISNLPIMSGFSVESFKQNIPDFVAEDVKSDKAYVSLVYSDGDNICVWYNHMHHFFWSDDIGRYPVSFGIAPAMYDVMPAIAKWYYQRLPKNGEFIADVSGIGYIRPETFAEGYSNREQIYEDFMEWTARYMEKMDLHTFRTVSGSDGDLRKYIDRIDFVHSVFADMGNMVSGGYDAFTYDLDGFQVFRSIVGWGGGRDGFVNDIERVLGDRRPVFVNALVHLWTFSELRYLSEALKTLPDDYVLVTPAQLAVLRRQAKNENMK